MQDKFQVFYEGKMASKENTTCRMPLRKCFKHSTIKFPTFFLFTYIINDSGLSSQTFN